MGTFEIALGVLLIVEPLGRSTIFYLSASVWTLVGGFILIGDAIRLWRVRRESIQ